MSKQKSPRNPESKWVYFVFNWGSPIGCFTSGALALSLVKMLVAKWGNPLPEGALKVVRYAPAIGFYRCKEEDLTSSFFRILGI